MAEPIRTYRDFWPYYLGEHSRAGTRTLHYVGTTMAIACLTAFAASGTWWFLGAAVIAGYAFAWLGHLLIEHNRPATFTYPIWSLASDFRMYACWLGGRLDRHLAR